MSIFSGLKVIDVASFIAAPSAAMILGDFGADVIKIEPPAGGDPHRNTYRIPVQPSSEHNYAWAMASRNKRSLALDLKHQAGRAVLERLVSQADVLITNYPPAVRERLGLSHAQLEPFNSRLIHASLTGYGESGPEANKPGFDAAAYWARSGLADLMRPHAGSAPASAAAGLGDYPAGITLFAAVASALYARERTGRGSAVSVSLLGCGAWANAMSIQASLCGAEVVCRTPRHQPRNALTNFYLCADGRWFILNIINGERDWTSFAHALEAEHLLDDPRFMSEAGRQAHAIHLAGALDVAFARRTSDEWQQVFEASGHTVGLVARTADAALDPQMRHAGAIIESAGVDGATATVDSPFQIRGVAKTPPGAAPTLGQHSDAILYESGFDPADVARLRSTGTIG